MFSGTVRVRDQVQLSQGKGEKVTGVSVFEHGSAVQRASVAAGRIGRLCGLREVRIGEAIGEPRTTPERNHFAPPTLETVVVPSRPACKGGRRGAVARVGEGDPGGSGGREEVRQEGGVARDGGGQGG